MVRKRNRLFWISVILLAFLLTAGCTGPAAVPTVTPAEVSPTAVEAGPTESAVEPSPTTAPTATGPAAPTAAPTAVPTATAAAAATADENFKLTVLHTNDVHSHHAADTYGNGGEALAASVIHQVRASAKNTILLSAGDTSVGTLFYVLHQGLDSAELMNALQYDAMTLGNHEFDKGDDTLAAFIGALKFPVVAANVDFEKSPALAGKTQPYTILERSGEKIGVIGLVNPETPTMSRPGSDLVFDSDLKKAVETNVAALTQAGVNKIIVLSHLGYPADLELAKSVSGVDIIVGGHTHTLLANYDTRAEGEYPAEVENPDGKTVLVVQAGENLEYVGELDVVFDADGELVDWSGDTIYLSHFITPDADIADMVTRLYAPVAELTQKVIGKSSIFLEGDRTVCRAEECNLGNLITDAMRAETGAQVALENGGGIRASIEPGDVTLGDVLTVLPFGNLTSTLKLSGKDLQAALENGVSQVETGGGRFPQVSGLRFTADLSKPAGSRILSVEVLDEKGNSQPLDPAAIYTVATNDYMRSGGDGYTMLKDNATDAYDFGRPLDEVLADYIQQNSPVSTDVEGRIEVKK
jgi:5'-nucleotidase